MPSGRKIPSATVYAAFRHSAAGAVENRRLVHVVPYAVDARGEEIFIECPPPAASFRTGEVRKRAVAGPDFSVELIAVCVFHEDVVALAG